MANYKKKKCARNSRARCHRYSWTCQGRLRYERHFKEMERVEKGLMAVNRGYEVAQILKEALETSPHPDISYDVKIEEAGCGCCCSLVFSVYLDGKIQKYFIKDDDINPVPDEMDVPMDLIIVPLIGEFPITAGIEILRAEMANVKNPFCALIRYKLNGVQPETGIRMDLNKQVFLDHFDEGSPQEEFMQSIMQRVWELIC